MKHCLLVLNSLLFGLGSWIAITGLWLEVPVLIHHLPEGWQLASYLTFAIQLANIVPFIYWYLNKKYSKYFNEISGTNIQLFIGMLASIVLIFFWETKIFIFGNEHSVVLLVCAFLLSIVDCLSSVTFLPFMARFRSVYLTPYLIGEGLSGFLPMVLALLQNVDEDYNPKESSLLFGPSIFFISLFLTIAISWIAFFKLQIHDFRKEQNLPLTTLQSFKKYFLGLEIVQKEIELEKRVKLIKKIDKLEEDPRNINGNSFDVDKITRESNKGWNKEKLEYHYLQFLIFFACTITFGVVPPLATFSCLPIDRFTLKYSVILSGLSYPIGCSIALFFKCKSTKVLTILALLATLITSFIFYFALHSPFLPYLPPIISTNKLVLSIMMISCWIMFNLLLSYVKTMITTILNDKNGQEALFYVGMFSQIGSLLGSSTMFVLVNHLKIFKEK